MGTSPDCLRSHPSELGTNPLLSLCFLSVACQLARHFQVAADPQALAAGSFVESPLSLKAREAGRTKAAWRHCSDAKQLTFEEHPETSATCQGHDGSLAGGFHECSKDRAETPNS